ncbi:tryptophan biosynthesis modulator TrpM [Streptomyces sp. NPDC048595]|uniref:tryptophan biosynthesis modulator TrpM n=1 Tax=Streptomyces sp. NPDC048595 TaxID=3365576 RepID=UPI0037127396
MTAAARIRRPSHRSGPAVLLAAAAGDGRHAALGRGCRPRGCRAPARRVRGRRVRYHIGSEPGQINGRRWRTAAAR